VRPLQEAAVSKPLKPRATFDTERAHVPGVLKRAGIMQAAILLAIAMFPALPISMPAFLLLLQAAAAANLAAAMRTKGLASLRDTKVDDLWDAMHTLRTYVQGLANNLDPVSAAALIESAGLIVGKTARHLKALVAATFVPATGVVHLVVNASMLIGRVTKKKTSFTWSWSTDGGKTWSNGITTSYTTVDVPNLGPATYLFRVFATVGKVPGEPSQGVSLTLH
jgi:hypothetical protein